MESKFSIHKRTVFIYVPVNFKESPNTLVIYKTDGLGYLEHWLKSIEVLTAARVITAPIIVNIGNGDERKFELLAPFLPSDHFDNSPSAEKGRADALLKFIEFELMPLIESKYSQSRFNVIAGHSYGGMFSLYALLERPSLFTAYLAFSPSLWIGHGVMVEKLQNMNNLDEMNIYAYLSRGEKEHAGFLPLKEQKQLVEHYNSLDAFFKQHSSKNIYWRYDVIPETGHGNTPIVSVPSALAEIFGLIGNNKL